MMCGQPSHFHFFLRERCDLYDQDRPPLGDAHPAQRDCTSGALPRPGLPKSASGRVRTQRSREYGRTGVGSGAQTPPARRSQQARTLILSITLQPQADPTCAPPCEATLSTPAHHAASEVEAPPSPITPFVSSCRYFPRSSHSVSLRMTYTAYANAGRS